MSTYGGSANSAYKISRFLQRVYKKFTLFAPNHCYSAGTVLALGASELILGPFSELGPLDVQLFKQNELGARKSGLLTRSAFQALEDSTFELFENFLLKIMNKSGGLISFRVAAEISSRMATGLMSGVFAKIDPDVVGSDQRDLEVAFHYGARLAEQSENAGIDAVYHLVHNYPAHDFIIDSEEAGRLFENVEYPSEELMLLAAICRHDGHEGTTIRSLSHVEKAEHEHDDQETGEKADGAANASGRDVGKGRRPRRPRNSTGTSADRQADGASNGPASEAGGSDQEPGDSAGADAQHESDQ